MKAPNSSELVYAENILRRLANYIEQADLETEYDLYLLSGAADTIDSFIRNENIKEIPNNNENLL